MSEKREKGAVGAQVAPAMGPPALINKEDIPAVLPILPLRNSVFFPGGVLPLAVGRAKTIALIKDAVRDEQVIGVVTQRKAEEEDPGAADLYPVGTVARVVKLLKMGEDNYSLVVQGLARFKVLELVQEAPYLKARIERGRGQDQHRRRRGRGARHQPEEAGPRGHRADAGAAGGRHRAGRVHHRPRPPGRPDRRQRRRAHRGEAAGPRDRRPQGAHEAGARAAQPQARDPQALQQDRLRREGRDVEDAARVLPAPAAQGHQGGAGRDGEEEEELDELQERLKQAGLPPDVEKVAQKELNRLKTHPRRQLRVHGGAHLPRLDRRPALVEADRRQPRPRERPRACSTTTTTAWRRSRSASSSTWRCASSSPTCKGPILCFVGPARRRQDLAGPVDRARHWAASSCASRLGGVRDEAEIRGHRRTYVGALPGRIIQAHEEGRQPTTRSSCSTRSTSSAPTSAATRRAALLEVLDPEQNNTFRDHYLDVPFDLSQGAVHRHRQPARPDPAGRCATAWRSSSCPATPTRRRCTSRSSHLIPQAARGARPQRRRSSTSPTQALVTRS